MLAASILLGSAGFTFAASLTAGDKQFLSGYENIRASLVAEDLSSAKKAASTLGDAGKGVLASGSLDEARAAFAKLSDTAEKLALGQPGYYVLHCPMVNKDWVQTTPQVSNPYGGKEMASCGEIKK